MLKTRADYFIFVILIGTSLFFDGNKYGVDARFFSDNKYEPLEKVQEQQYEPKQQIQEDRPLTDDEVAYYDYLMQRDNEKHNNLELSQILEELYGQELAERAAQESEQIQDPERFIKAEIPERQQQQQEVENVNTVREQERISPGEEEPQNLPESAPKMPTAQKKGQSEFVEFVEPPSAKVLKSLDSMDKRVPTEQLASSPNRGIHLLSTSGNIMFIAIVTMCCVISVVGVVGGVYYYNNRKYPENDFDDFTRYSPAGPGKKLASLRTNGVRMDENGDDSLAYKAQLHHYQQTKQKVIGTDDITPTTPTGSPHSIHHGENSEDEAEDLEEHNYSVYECPGLAPTGDIEVNNPNFGHSH